MNAAVLAAVVPTTTYYLILGAVLLLLGAFWERIRAVVLRALPFLPLDRLPPSVTSKD